MTKTVRVRSHTRADGTFVRAHNRTIKGAGSDYRTVHRSGSGYRPAYRSGGPGGGVAIGGGALVLLLLVLAGISSGGDNAPDVTGPSSTASHGATTHR